MKKDKRQKNSKIFQRRQRDDNNIEGSEAVDKIIILIIIIVIIVVYKFSLNSSRGSLHSAIASNSFTMHQTWTTK